MSSMRRIVRALRLSASATERSVGISAAQLFVLNTLSEESALSINEIAERTHTHQSSVSVVVTKLVDRGLAVRHTSARDARRAEVALTASGRALLAEAPDPVQLRLVRALHRISAEDRKALARGLDAWTETLGVADEPVSFFFEEEAATRG